MRAVGMRVGSKVHVDAREDVLDFAVDRRSCGLAW